MVKIKHNDQFRKFLNEFNLSENFDFQISIPSELQKLIDSPILASDYGITLEELNTIRNMEESRDAGSIAEDFENHFHIDSYIKTNGNKTSFMLGVRTLILLAKRFQKENFEDIRFTYSFQTPELCEKQARQFGLHEEGDTYYLSDRLCFHRRLHDQDEVLMDDLNEYDFEAVMTIDI